MPALETSRGALFYAQRGAGEPVLVCIHGAGGSHQHWGLQLQALGTTARIVALDLPGHGRSPGRGCGNIADYSRVVVAALDALDLDQVVLAGHSMGGAVALWTALTAPSRVAGLALVGTGARLPVMPALLENMEREPTAAIRLIVAYAYSHSAAPQLRSAGAAAFMRTNPQIFHADLLACHAFDVRTRLGAVTCPTLVICGNEDRITPPKFSQYLYNSIAGSKLVMVPAAGHMVLLEQPEAVNTALSQFVQEIRAANRREHS